MKCLCGFINNKNGSDKLLEDNKFYSVFQNIKIPTIVLNNTDEVEYINNAAVRLLITFTDCSLSCGGRKCREKIHGWLQEGLCNLENEKHYELLVDNKGKKRYLEISLKKLFNGRNEKIGTIVNLNDVTDQYLAEKYISRSFEVTKTIYNITSYFVGNFDLDSAINNALADIGRISDASRVYIFRIYENGEKMENIYEWCAEGVTPKKYNLRDLPTKMFPWWMKQLYEDKIIHVTDISKMPEEAGAEKEILESQGIKSLLVVPIKRKDELIGYLGVDNVYNTIKWNSFVSQLLQLAGKLFSSVFERKETEEALLESEKRFRELFESVNVAIFLHRIEGNGASGRFIMVNDFACKLLGYEREELLGMKPEDTVGKSQINEIKLLIKDIVRKGHLTFETTFVNKEGKTIPVEVNSHICVIDGEEMLMSIAKDISQRKKAEEEIKILHRAIDQSSILVIITDYNGKIQYVNTKFTEMTGYTFEEVIGKTPSILKAGKKPLKFYESMVANIRSGKEWRGELENTKKSGETYWVLTSISPILNEYGQITHYIAIEEDITERKKMEIELKKRNKELNDTLDRLKSMQQQLIHQEKMAGIGQLAAGVAHEINNPLGYVTSNFEILKKYLEKYRGLIDKYNDYAKSLKVCDIDKNELDLMLKEIVDYREENSIDFIDEDIDGLFVDTMDGLSRISKIVNGLRTFSRIERQENFEEYDLNEGIENTLLIANNEIKYYAEVKKELTPIPVIDALTDQINQVLLNIIVNAAQAIRKKNENNSGIMGMISIRTYSDSEFVYCEIEDNGIGIPEKNISRIFNPFFTTKPVGQGTGLGLSISYDIIKNKHNGDILVSSTQNVGTKFTIKLPIKQEFEEEI